MLHESDPAIVDVLGVVSLALVDVAEIQFAELRLVGVHRRTGVSRHHLRIARRRFTVAKELEVGKGLQLFTSTVDDLKRLVDQIAAAPERNSLGHGNPIGFGRGQGNG